jgi:hypothetical protein
VCSCIHNTRHHYSALNEQGNVSTITCRQLQNTYEATKEALCLLQRDAMVAIDAGEIIPHGLIVSQSGYYVTHPYLKIACSVK